MDFKTTLEQRIKEKQADYSALKHQRDLFDVELERAKANLETLNTLLEAEGGKRIVLREPIVGSSVKRPGNRAKDYPVRRVEWEGQPLRTIIQTILVESPLELHGDDIAKRIYEIQTPMDLRRVKPSLVSQLHRGSKLGFWQAVGKNKYRTKVTESFHQLEAVGSSAN